MTRTELSRIEPMPIRRPDDGSIDAASGGSFWGCTARIRADRFSADSAFAPLATFRKFAAICSSTGSHWRRRGWRNNLTLEYQGLIFPCDHPTPRRHARQQRPSRRSNGAGQVYCRIADGNDQIERRNFGGVAIHIHQRIALLPIQNSDTKLPLHFGKIIDRVAVLQIDEGDIGRR